jgi:hypothetical protein
VFEFSLVRTLKDQVFADGISRITVAGGTVRLDFAVLSPTQTDPNGHPVHQFQQRVIMGTDGFILAAEKISETAKALVKLAGPVNPGPASVEQAILAQPVPQAVPVPSAPIPGAPPPPKPFP